MNPRDLVLETDHYRGNLDASVVLIEYGDFECPHCAQAFPEIERLISNTEDQICFVYRHFPLATVHPHAELAALSAEAAGLQGRFWDMHHYLYRNYDQLSEDNIFEMASTLNLNLDRFREDVSSDEVMNLVRNDFSLGIRSGVNGTPALFFNGLRYDGPRNYQALKLMVKSLISGGEVHIQP